MSRGRGPRSRPRAVRPGRHQEALDVATRALAAYTDSSPLLVAAGRATIAVGGRGSRRAGLELLRRALAVDPDDVDALSVLGVALMHTVSHGDEGERLLDRAVELAPDDPGAAYSRALALEHRSIVRYDKAHAAVLRALELAPHDPEVRLLKAKVDLGRVGWVNGSGRAEVADDLRAILADDPENAEAAYLLARTEVKTNRAEVAHDFQRVVRIDPRHGDANAQVDSVLVGPLRQAAYWWLWLLVAVQALLLWRGADGAAAAPVAAAAAGPAGSVTPTWPRRCSSAPAAVGAGGWGSRPSGSVCPVATAATGARRPASPARASAGPRVAPSAEPPAGPAPPAAPRRTAHWPAAAAGAVAASARWRRRQRRGLRRRRRRRRRWWPRYTDSPRVSDGQVINAKGYAASATPTGSSSSPRCSADLQHPAAQSGPRGRRDHRGRPLAPGAASPATGRRSRCSC